MYLYIFNRQRQFKDMKQMAQVSHNNGVAVKTSLKINLARSKIPLFLTSFSKKSLSSEIEKREVSKLVVRKFFALQSMCGV